ncbi:MAG: septum formation protein Maf [Betaproteobacteria bacterium]|nr:septum formation protein Maf [Betaproteobacteria bacterium]
MVGSGCQKKFQAVQGVTSLFRTRSGDRFRFVKLILASTSRYRKQLLSRLGILFEVAAPDVDESALPGELPEALALRLARAKTLNVAANYTDALVVGSDQVASCGSELLGKPGNLENATRQLLLLSGREAVFHTALCVHSTATHRTLVRCVSNLVVFRTLTATQIDRYLRKEKPFDCAGSAKSEGLGIALIQKMGGDDPNALIGLPLIALIDLLHEHGREVL